MKKFFLIPLLTLFSCVMAFADNVARIGETEYATVAAAVTAANGITGDVTITMLTNSTATTAITISNNITIDGGEATRTIKNSFNVSAEKTLTLKNMTVNSSASKLTRSILLNGASAKLILSDATIEPKVSGCVAVGAVKNKTTTIELADGTSNTIRNISGSSTIYNASTSSYTMTITGNGALNVEHRGTGGYALACAAGSAKFAITASNITATSETAGHVFSTNLKASSIKDGVYSDAPADALLPDGYAKLALTGENAGKYKVLSLSKATATANGIKASVGKTAYTSLAAAIEAASIFGEITLYADAPATTISKSLTINANGHNASAISAAAGYARTAIDGGYAFGKVNKEGNVYTVSDFEELWLALNYAADNGDEIQLTADINYGTVGYASNLNIKKSLTIDGQGHALIGAGKRDANSGQHATIWVNLNGTDSVAVTFKDIKIVNSKSSTSTYAIQTRGKIKSLTLNNVYLQAYEVPLQIGGNQASKAKIQLDDCYLYTPKYYCLLSWNPYELVANNTKFEGWNALYFKGENGSTGSEGTVAVANNCNFNCPNYNSGTSNSFGMFVCEDDGVSITLNNCTMDAEQFGDQYQWILVLSEFALSKDRVQPVSLTINGDNTYINGLLLDNAWCTTSRWTLSPYEDHNDAVVPNPFPLSITISGGTYNFNPEQIYWYKNSTLDEPDKSAEANKGRIVIPDGYEVKEIATQQGDVATTLYRVRKEITTSYSINQDVEGEGAGQNEHTEFLISSNETVAAESTVANYVEVSNNATLTVPTGKELEVTNGLDVTGGATLVVEAGSTIVVGEGGVTSENTESIVIEANESGSASFLLDPEVIVNTTPNLTVKMTVKGKGYKNETSGKTYYWQRFAAPVVMAEAWSKAPDYGTWLYGWDYTAEGGKGAWAELASSKDMVPFQGYTLSPEHLIASEDEEIVYSFKGQLAGNQNMNLQFNARGFNFFGNSYTGYISVLTLVDQLMGNENIDGTVYMWNNGEQGYEPVSLQDLKANPSHYLEWQKEIAPMQTFILRQVNTGEAVSTQLNYENSIWNNPRYGNVPAPAPAPKRAAADADPFVRVMITAANGQNSQMSFAENADRSDDFEKGYDALKYMNENSINLYSSLEGQDLANVATNDLEGKTLTLQTNDEIAYTMSFPIVEGEKYAIRDNATGAVVAIEEGTTYEFAAQPNSTVEGRFEIVNRYEVVTALENTEVKANAKGIYSITGQYLGEDFNALPSGVYVVNGVKIVK